MTREEEIAEMEEQIAACDAAIKKLLGKTHQTVSIGDQSFSLVDVEKLLRVRDHLRNQLSSLQGAARRTIKVRFPTC